MPNSIITLQNDTKKVTSLTLSSETIQSGTFEIPYSIASCMIINGIATTSIEWSFESSKPHIAITLEIQYCKTTCGAKTVLSDGSKYNDSGVYQVEQEGIYQFLFWNKDSDQERTNITYYIVFDPGIHPPLIPSFPLLNLSLVSFGVVIIIIIFRIRRK